jgi:hypothetical protein
MSPRYSEYALQSLQRVSAKVPTLAENYGANLRAVWDTRSGAISGGNWADTISGRTMTIGAGSPTLAVDGSNFKGLPVYNYNGASAHGYNGSGNAIVAASSGVYMWQVRRDTGAVSGESAICWDASFSEVMRFNQSGAVAAALWAGNPVGAGFAAPQAVPQLIELYTEQVTGIVRLRVGGVIVGSYSALAVTPVALERVNIGRGGNFPSCFLAQHGIVNISPSALQLSNSYARAKLDFGVA